MTNAPHYHRDLAAGILRVPPDASFSRFRECRSPASSPLAFAASALAHAVIGLAVLWSASSGIDRYVRQSESAQFIPPPPSDRTAQRGSGSRTLAMVHLSYEPEKVATAGATNRVAGQAGHRTRGVSESIRRPATDSAMSAGDDVYTVFQVDNAAQISAGSAVPQYPPDLLAKRIRGKVIVRFIVDSSGVADIQSIEVLDSSAPQFEESVRAALPRMRFSPARLNGKRVRQLVEQPFRFDVVPPTPTDSAA